MDDHGGRRGGAVQTGRAGARDFPPSADVHARQALLALATRGASLI